MKTYRIETVSTFYHTYLVSQPDEHEPKGCQYPVTCEDVEELTQKHLGDLIIGYKEVTDEEILEEIKDTYLEDWSIEMIREKIVHDVR